MADGGPANDAPYRLLDAVDFGEDVVVQAFANLYGCRIGDGARIGPFVEIQRGAVVGARCKISSHSFVCEGVELGDVILDVGGKAVRSAGDIRSALSEAKNDGKHDVLMKVKTSQATKFVAMPIG